jgi:multisubunit Na+/H+ antiporter MnhG subunit
MPPSGPLILLAYAAAAAVILPALALIALGRVPTFMQRGAAQNRRRTRMEGAGLLLIGLFILADVLAVDLGRRSSVPQNWILLVWVLLAAGLIGVRYLVGRASSPAKEASA